MRVLFAGGGTGGHINPAISIADYIKSKDENFEGLFVGTKKGLETKLVPAAGYDIKYIDIMGFNRKNLLKNITVIKKLIETKRECKRIIKEFKPDYVVCTGGYVSGPVAMAAHACKVPALIHEQNVYPGLTVKGAEKYVSCIAVSFEETLNHLKKDKCVVTGNPVRTKILEADKAKAREALGLGEEPFVLIFGGSLGADKINENVIGMLHKVCSEKKFRLKFATGDRNFDKINKTIQEKQIELSNNVEIVPYINNMHEVMAAADIVVCRSGAITLSEIAVLGKPSVLIPSPNVVRNHQEQNAREFERGGAAKVITEDVLTSDLLYNTIADLASDKEALDKMGCDAKAFAKRDALEKIYEIVKKAEGNR